jgi:hypothetical protein
MNAHRCSGSCSQGRSPCSCVAFHPTRASLVVRIPEPFWIGDTNIFDFIAQTGARQFRTLAAAQPNPLLETP